MTLTSETTSTAPRLPSELVASTSFLFKRLGMAAKERAMAAYERAGVSAFHYAVLSVLDESPRGTQGAIADALGYDRGQLVGFLDELEERGFVERKRDPSDRRRHTVSLTPDGKRELGRLRRLARKLDQEFLAPLDEEERATLHELLVRLTEVHEPRCKLPLPAPKS